MFRTVYLNFKRYNVNTVSIHYFAFLFFTLGSWFADGPQYLFNGGFIELIAINWFLSYQVSKKNFVLSNDVNVLNRKVSDHVR